MSKHRLALSGDRTQGLKKEEKIRRENKLSFIH